MKHVLLMLIMLTTLSIVSIKAQVFTEDFEGTTVDMISSSTGAGVSWGINDRLFSQGAKSDSVGVTLGDTTYLTTATFSTLGKYAIYLDFSQICKIQLFDSAYIEVSNNNGATWQRVKGAQYLGTGLFGNFNNHFCELSYPGIWKSVPLTPQQSWWQDESFDLSTLVADAAQVKVRFVLFDADNNGAVGRNGWFIDDVIIRAEVSEQIPPTISLINPATEASLSQITPYKITARINDASGIDTAYIAYSANGGIVDSVPMIVTAVADSFVGYIPFVGFGRTIDYQVFAKDASLAYNLGVGPASGTYKIHSYYLPELDTATYAEGFEGGFPSTWTQETTDEMNWTLTSDGTSSSDTGPDTASEGVNYMYTEASGFNDKIGLITSATYDISDIQNAVMTFEYHMYGSTMGDLKVHLYSNGSWTNDVLIISGEQHTGHSDPWSTAKVSLENHKTADFKFRIEGHTGSSYYSDISVDNFQIGPGMPLPTDAGISKFISPSIGTLNNVAFDVKVKLNNFGSSTLTSTNINWSLDGTPKPQTTFTGQLLPGTDSIVTLGNLNLAGGIYTISSWTDAPNNTADENLLNDTTTYNFFVCTSVLNGTYTINPAGSGANNFTSFTAVEVALMQCGISGPVTFNVTAGVYNENIELNTIGGSSATNTIIFQSATGDSSTVVLAYNAVDGGDNYVVKLNGASNITFKDMTIQALDSTFARVFVLGNNSENLSFNNNVIKTVRSSVDDNNMALIYGYNNIGNDLDISNNMLFGANNSVRLISGVAGENWTINNNIFDQVHAAAIVLTRAKSVQIMNNIIIGDTAGCASTFQGISLVENTGTAMISENNLLTINSNIVYGIRLSSCDFDSISHTTIVNNFIQLAANSASTNLSAGILNQESKNVDIYFNTVRLSGDHEYSTAISLYDATAGLSKHINIVNNLFTNDAGGYIYYTTDVDTSLWNDHNNVLYNYESENTYAYLDGAVESFDEWIIASGTNNTYSIDPYFTSATDLHVLNNLLNGFATPIAGITTDIDGDTRDAVNPDNGADEFTPSPYDVIALSVLTPMSSCGLTSTETVTVRFRNIGSAAINGSFNAKYQLLGSATIVTEAVTANIPAGDTLDFAFATKANLDVSSFGSDSAFIITAWGDLTGDNVSQNDTTSLEVLSGYVPANLTVSNTTINYGEIDTLYSAGLNPYWWASDTASTELANDSMFITPNLYDTTTYWISDRAGSGSMDVQVGIDVLSNTSSGIPCTYANYYEGNKEQYLYLASELNAMGISGGPITSLQFNITALNSMPALNNFEIKIGSTSDVDLSTAWQTGLTTVIGSSVFTGVVGWNLHTFNTPYEWDGVSNLVVEVCSNNANWVSAGNAAVEKSATAFNATRSRRADQAGVCQLTTVNSSYSTRPNTIFSVVGQGCYSINRTSFDVIVQNIPSIDASISAIITPLDTVLGNTDLDLTVEIENYGTSTLTSLDVIYSLNSVIQDTIPWTGSIPYQNSVSLVIDTLNVLGGMYDLVVWSHNPNNVADTINTNDTTELTFVAHLNGNYTIGDGPTFDFPDFVTAVDALKDGGVSGPCIFNMDADTFVNQVVIPEIYGTSDINNVVFQSANGDSSLTVISFAPTTADNYVIKLDGADYFTFKQLTIKATATGSYNTVIEIGNESTHNNFFNNVVQSLELTTSYTALCFDSPGANDDYTQIINNHIMYGYTGIEMRGATTSDANNEKGTVIKDNLIEGYYYYGIYMYGQDSVIVKGNTVINGTNSNYMYPMYMYYCNEGMDVSNNTLISTPLNTCYGLRIYYSSGNALERSLISNNMISVIGGSATSTSYGINVYQATFADVYNNSINMRGISSNSRAANIYSSNAGSEVNFVNNILYDSVGFTLYLQNSTGLGQLDYNSHYTNSVNMAYDGGNKADLAALQASSGKETNSVYGDPLYTSNIDLHLLSTNLSGLAIPLSVVPEDIDGKLRHASTPTIGAHEVDLLPIDLAIKEILLVPANTTEFTSYPVNAVIKNTGTDTIFGFQVNYIINSGTSVVNTFTTFIAPLTTDTVALTPFSSPAGSSHICLTVVAVGDGNVYNDDLCQNFFGTPQKDAYVVSLDEIEGGCSLTTDTVTIWITNVGVDTINGPSQTGIVTVSFKNDNIAAATVTTENFTTQVIPGDTVSYEFTGLVDLANTTQLDSAFTVTAWITYPGDNVTYNDTATTDVLSSHIPMDPVFTSPITLDYATAALISATATDSIYWYNYDTSTVEFYMGSNYQSGLFFATDTLYLEANTGGGNFKLTETVQYKGGSGATSPYPSYLGTGDFDGVEISNLGTSPGDIAGYEINVVSGANHYTYVFPPNTMIDAGNVAIAFYVAGISVGPVGNNAFCINDGYTGISSNSSCVYYLIAPDGTVVDAFNANNGIFPISSGVTAADFTGVFPDGSTVAGATRLISDNNDAGDWALVNTTPSSFGAFNTGLPQAGGAGCVSNRLPLVVNVNSQQANDLHASTIVEPFSMLNLNSTEDVKVKIFNYGTASQTNFDIAYQLNNNTPVTATVGSTLLSGDSLVYTFAQSVDMSTLDSTYMLKAYTDLTNDQNRLNDTVEMAIENIEPNYCISSANYTSYLDLTTVTMGTWSHTDATSGQLYTDYTNTIAPVYIYASQSYAFDLLATASSSPYLSYAKVYIDYNRDGDFEDAGEMVFGNSFTPPAMPSGMITIPQNAILGPTRMRVIVQRSGTVTSVQPCGTYSYGETEDYTVFVMEPIPNDAGVETFVGLTNLTSASSLPITSRIRNYGTDPITSIDINYYVNVGGTVNTVTYNTAPIAPGDSVDVFLGNVAISDGMNEVCAYTTLPNDTNTFNDSLCYNVFREAVVNLSFSDDFEGVDLWMPDTLLNQWERGIPTMTNINTAHSPVNVWAIDLDGTYDNSRSQLLYSPKFVITNNIDSAMLKFWHYYDNQMASDGGYIQYSKNSGPWLSLGYVQDTRATAWYTDATGGTNKFSGTSTGWVESTFNFDFTSAASEFVNTDTIQLRFNFYSNASGNTGDGWAIDDVRFELPLAANDIGVTDITNPINTAQIGSPVTVTIDISNFGSATQTSFDVWYQIGNNPIVTETFTPTGGLAYLDTVSYTFTTTGIAPSTDFVVCSGTNLLSDVYPQNDDKCSDVIVVTAANIDGGVTAIGKIQIWGGNDTTSIHSDVVVKAEVKNFGITSLTSFDVEYSIDGGANWTTEAWTGSLATNDVDTFIFATIFNSPLGNYSLCIRTVVPNDAFIANDMKCDPYIGSGLNDADGVIFEVSQNEPNPAVGNVRINYIVPTNGDINFQLRNTLGQVIYSTEQASFTGKNTIEVDADKLANGVYYYSVVFDGQRITRKMIVNQ